MLPTFKFPQAVSLFEFFEFFHLFLALDLDIELVSGKEGGLVAPLVHIFVVIRHIPPIIV